MSPTSGDGGADPDHRPDPGSDRTPLLPRAQRLDRPDPRPAVPPVGGLPQAVPALVGAELVPLQAGQPAATRLSVEHRWPGGLRQPQSPGGHGPADSAGESDLGILPG